MGRGLQGAIMTGNNKYSKRKKGGSPILLSLIIFAIAVGAYYIWVSYKAPTPSVETPADKKPSTYSNKPVIEKKNITVDKNLSQLVTDAANFLKQKEYVKAKNAALKVVKSDINHDNPVWKKAADILGKANIAIFTTDVPAPGKTNYMIQRGDSLDKISKKFNTTIAAIQKSNGMDSTNQTIHPGNQLFIYKGNWFIRISKSEFKLYLYDGTDLFKVYNIGIGRQDRTPEGTFDITDKVVEPVWEYKGKQYPYGHEENVLGTRWMRLTPTGTTSKNFRGYGIHGTWEPKSIGQAKSNGCIRMLNDDVQELFDLLPKYKTVDNKFIEVIIEK